MFVVSASKAAGQEQAAAAGTTPRIDVVRAPTRASRRIFTEPPPTSGFRRSSGDPCWALARARRARGGRLAAGCAPCPGRGCRPGPGRAPRPQTRGHPWRQAVGRVRVILVPAERPPGARAGTRTQDRREGGGAESQGAPNGPPTQARPAVRPREGAFLRSPWSGPYGQIPPVGRGYLIPWYPRFSRSSGAPTFVVYRRTIHLCGKELDMSARY